MRKVISVFLISIFIMVTTNGCIEKKAVSNSSIGRNYIIYNIGKLPKSLAFPSSSDMRYNDILSAVFQGLVKIDEENKIVPELAESFDISKDGICYTFKIREDARWSSGDKITAQDFVDFFKDILNEDTNNIYASQLYYIFGVKDYCQNKKDFSTVAIRAIDNDTLEIRLNFPCDYFLSILCNPIFGLRKIDSNLDNWQQNYNDIKYTGPYVIKNISKNSNITIVKNDKYWDIGNVNTSKIVLKTLENSESALANFNGNQVDIFTNPPTFELSKLTSENKVLCSPSLQESMLVFNMKNNDDMNDSNLRKAIAYDINRIDLASDSINGEFTAEAYIPGNISNEEFKKANKYFKATSDLETAKKYFQKSKYDLKNKIKLVYLKGPENQKDCGLICKIAKSDLGLNIEAKGYDSDELNQIIKDGNYDMVKTDFKALYDDAYAFLEYWDSENNANIYGYNNYNYSNLLYKIKLEKDNSKRGQLMINAENMIMDDMPMIPLYFYNTLVCKNDSVDGIYMSSIGNIYLDRVTKSFP